MSAITNQYNSAFSASSSLIGKGDELDKEAFLMLMVTQFQYQDPLNPSEDTDYVAQLAQFSSLEQMMNMNESMDSMVESQNRQISINAASFIGKEVVAQGYGISVTDGESSHVSYGSDADIASGTINIFDANNNLVATVALEPSAAGVHDFDWNCKLADGSLAPNGVYSFAISAQDANGETVITQAQVSGKVTAVSNYNNVQYLLLEDGRVVSLDEVTEIMEPKASAPEVEGEEDTDADEVDPDDTTAEDTTTDETNPDDTTADESNTDTGNDPSTISQKTEEAAAAVADIPNTVSNAATKARSAVEEFLEKTPSEILEEIMANFKK